MPALGKQYKNNLPMLADIRKKYDGVLSKDTFPHLETLW
jgi:hypothetical protein